MMGNDGNRRTPALTPQVIFIDEILTIPKKKSSKPSLPTHRENTLDFVPNKGGNFPVETYFGFRISLNISYPCLGLWLRSIHVDDRGSLKYPSCRRITYPLNSPAVSTDFRWFSLISHLVGYVISFPLERHILQKWRFGSFGAWYIQLNQPTWFQNKDNPKDPLLRFGWPKKAPGNPDVNRDKFRLIISGQCLQQKVQNLFQENRALGKNAWKRFWAFFWNFP